MSVMQHLFAQNKLQIIKHLTYTILILAKAVVISGSFSREGIVDVVDLRKPGDVTIPPLRYTTPHWYVCDIISFNFTIMLCC